MNKLFLIFLSLFLACHAAAQNLVPNPNFALYNSCPTNVGQLKKCTNWYVPSYATSDYFNACHDTVAGSAHTVGVPDNGYGTQTSASNAYIGILIVGNFMADNREYAGTVLPALLPGAAYRVLLRLSLADNAYWAANAPAVFFFRDMDTVTATLSVLPYTPQVDFGYAGHITEKTGWTTVTDTFFAGAAYTHMVIGNFSNDAATTKTVFPSATAANKFCLFYIDSVAVELIPGLVRVTPANNSLSVRIAPNPLTEKALLQIEGLSPGTSCTFMIMNIQGQVVRTITNVATGQSEIPCTGLAPGLYYCRLQGADGVLWHDKMVVR